MPVSSRFPRTACFTCWLPIAECVCQICSRCDERVVFEDICVHCGCCTANGCCQCMSCATPECDVRSASRNVLCGDCGSCLNHCTCYVCNTCHVRLEPNIRNSSSLRRTHWCSRCNNCATHCVCYRCHFCNSITGVQCSFAGNSTACCGNCGQCTDHCECAICSVCEQRVRRSHTCGCCESCCSCNVKGVRFRNGKFMFHNSSFGNGEFKKNKLRRYLAVEIEVDSFDEAIRSTAVNNAINTWRDPVVRDGSIGDYGFEITSNPSNGDKFLKHMKDVTSGLRDINARCSEKCGLHVHVNVKGDLLTDKEGKPILDENGRNLFDKRTAYSQYDLRRLIRLYQKVEAAMFALCTDRRLTSRYSTICGDYWATINPDFRKFRRELVTKMYFEGNPIVLKDNNDVNRRFGTYRSMGNAVREKKSHKYEQIRYKALNIHSYFMRGTIEFRHHEGTIDYDEIVNWSLICGTLVDMASKLTDAEVSALPNEPFQALLAILPSDLQAYCKTTWGIFNQEGWERYKLILQDKFPSASPLTAGIPITE